MITGMAIATQAEVEQAMTIWELFAYHDVHFGVCGVRRQFVAWYQTPAGRVRAYGDTPLGAIEGLLQIGGGNGS